MVELVRKLTGTFGVSGNEEGIREIIENEIRANVDEIRVDPLGNLIAIKKGTGKRIMVAAHMDQIGIMVTHIDKNGFIRFSNLGGVNPFMALAQRVRFQNGTVGILHYEKNMEDMKNLKLSKMFIDIGATSREEAETRISIGDTATFIGEAVMVGNSVSAVALDDRIGCAILIKTLQNLSSTDNEIYFVFTVQEELGTRGAGPAAFGLDPDLAIVVDVTATGDTPGAELMEVKHGGGPAIKIKDSRFISHPDVKRLIEDAAIKNNIPYQFEILLAGGSDGGPIHVTKSGIPTGAISIPCRYLHTPTEMIHLDDMKNAVTLLTACLQE